MDAIWTVTGTITATLALAISSLFATSAPAEPIQTNTAIVVTVCGSGGLVPPTAENKCSKP
jgi:hypothetical protein